MTAEFSRLRGYGNSAELRGVENDAPRKGGGWGRGNTAQVGGRRDFCAELVHSGPSDLHEYQNLLVGGAALPKPLTARDINETVDGSPGMGASAPLYAPVPASFAERLRPARIEAFGGNFEVQSIYPEAPGTPDLPRIVYVDDEATARTIMRHAVGDPADPMRVAFTGTRYGATGSEFLASHSYHSCTAAVWFWTDTAGVQQATLFHFFSFHDEEPLREKLAKAVKESGREVASWDSVSILIRGERDGSGALENRQRAYEGLLEKMTMADGTPYRRLEAGIRSMALAIDVRNRTIATMRSELLAGMKLPDPVR